MRLFNPLFQSALQNSSRSYSTGSLPPLLQNPFALKSKLQACNVYWQAQYLQDQFCYWLNQYVKQAPRPLKAYFNEELELNALCQDFIQFCFKQGIQLDKEKTLEAFAEHDARSDRALKQELSKLPYRAEVKLLGFGLGNGDYEKKIASFLVQQKLASTVKIYGFDPYPDKTPGIEFLSAEAFLSKDRTPSFNLITARWVLHHVALKDRWGDLVRCINHSEPGAALLIAEHGLWRKTLPHFTDQKLYYLLNATFDVIANIGIRPQWFTDTAPHIGSQFFIHYLEEKDFLDIKNNIRFAATQTIYDVGPAFPNQTICTLRIGSKLSP